MATTKLTKTIIDELTYDADGGKTQYAWDSTVQGFGIRIYPSGKKSFVISYRIDGKKCFMTLGRYGVLTLDNARKQAKVELAKVLQGEDPSQKRKKKSDSETMKNLCDRFIEEYAIVHKKTWQEDKRRLDKHVIPALGKQKVDSITRSDINALHQKLGKTAKYEANRVLALLSKVFEIAIEYGVVPAEHPNPARKIKKFKEEKRDRWVKQDEMPRLAKEINKEENIYIRSALWMYLLTGMRKNELLSVKWDDVDVRQKQIRLADTKSGHVHYVPLSSAALEVIEKIPRKAGNPYLLPGARKGRPLVNVTKSWYEIRKKAKLEDVRLHDLRRTVGSWMATQGDSLLLIGKVLNHADPQTTAVYAHLSREPMDEAMEKHGIRVMEVIQGGNKDVTED